MEHRQKCLRKVSNLRLEPTEYTNEKGENVNGWAIINCDYEEIINNIYGMLLVISDNKDIRYPENAPYNRGEGDYELSIIETKSEAESIMREFEEAIIRGDKLFVMPECRE